MNDQIAPPPARKAEELPPFDLQNFFPYLVRVFYSDVTRSLSAIYQRDYGMMPAEWRTMAILGGADGGLQANEIVARSSMDKVVVSRAVKKMDERGFLTRESNAADGRSSFLSLSPRGQEVYEDLVPKILKVEATMLQDLSEDEIATFLRIMKKIRSNLTDLGPPK